MTNATGSGLRSDRNLLIFKNYEDYLDSLVKSIDLGYLGNSRVARQIAELGYWTASETIDRESFLKRVRAAKELLSPVYRAYVLDSELTIPTDNLQRELSLRERGNRLGVLSTIIYIRKLTRLKHEISAYIDYADRLKNDDWQRFFEGKKKLSPRRSDLAYFNWRLNKTLLNDTAHYRPMIDKKRGLCFSNVHDRILISVDPQSITPGVATTRVRIYSPQYDNIVLYDHALRQ